MTVFASDLATRDGRRYFFRVSFTLNGKRHFYESKKFKFKEEARKAEAAFLLEKNKQASARHSFHELIAEYLQAKKQAVKPTTFANIQNCLRHADAVLGRVRINRLTKDQWSGFLQYLTEQKMNNHRRNRIIEYTRAVCEFSAKKYDVFTNIPYKFEKFNEQADRPVDKKMEFWTPAQFQTFISVVDDLMYSALFTLLFATGLRSGEALALQWQDIDFARQTVSVSKTANTKQKGGRFIILPPKTRSSYRTIRVPQKALDLLFALHEQVADHPLFSAEAFVFFLDRPIPNSTLQKRKAIYLKKAQEIDPTLPSIRLHSFRHSTASALINSGATVIFISQYLGHSSTKETLDTYAHFFPSEADQMADRMNSMI